MILKKLSSAKSALKILHSLLIHAVVFLIRIYRYWVSPLLNSPCIYHPSCSAYAVEAFQKHGIFHGFRLTGMRILRCHPYEAGGMDPVPPKK